MNTHTPEAASAGFSNVIIRYNANGTLDTSFGSGGFLYMNWNNAANAFGTAYAMAIQRVQRTDEFGNVVIDERIVVGGAYNVTGACCQYRVDRYLPDGNPDFSFGTSGNGRVIIEQCMVSECNRYSTGRPKNSDRQRRLNCKFCQAQRKRNERCDIRQ